MKTDWVKLFFGLGLSWILASTALSQGDDFVDQAVTSYPPQYLPLWSAVVGPSITNSFGQEFVPTLNSMDFVSLEIFQKASAVTSIQIHASLAEESDMSFCTRLIQCQYCVQSLKQTFSRVRLGYEMPGFTVAC